jgi:hypothetical protein
MTTEQAKHRALIIDLSTGKKVTPSNQNIGLHSKKLSKEHKENTTSIQNIELTAQFRAVYQL